MKEKTTLEYCGKLFKHITAVLDCIWPLTTVFVPTTKPKWIINDIIELMRDRDSFYRKARRYGQPDDWNIARFLRNRVDTAIRNYQSEFIKD